LLKTPFDFLEKFFLLQRAAIQAQKGIRLKSIGSEEKSGHLPFQAKSPNRRRAAREAL